ncbi:MAG: hypothetical protein A3G34_03825 [Candidatus Lindowbacteria bacterium RIFCSPLOWO2_12_FULL_62_27]|nr:MAG: hypothetical protein A3I06_11280 [Candidatus Lindowbacteria bacterium RIFCSPLOWO2_02_FULL_62_12]OGH59538.1 MAG: hypothetical protein A3G34_03825 [Candidatus Lindowbacteria bacterium RIFCSPLOWO2_12_FULL_62_27]
MEQGERIYEIFRKRAKARELTVQEIVNGLGKKDTTHYSLYQFSIGKSMPPIHKLAAYFESVGMRLLLEADGNVYALEFKDRVQPKREGDRMMVGERVSVGGEYADLTPDQISAVEALVASFRATNKRVKRSRVETAAKVRRAA